MARVKAVWGPTETKVYTFAVTWMFTGIRENGEYCRWKLTFYLDSRKFRTKAVRLKGDQKDRPELSLLPAVQQAEVVDGPVTPMLRAKLSPEHIAKATALAMKFRR